jgi:CBS domain-containing protein
MELNYDEKLPLWNFDGLMTGKISMNNNAELTAADIMQLNPQTVRSDMSLPQLEVQLLTSRVSGFPVVDSGRRLEGLVSRSDVIRAICKERELASKVSDFYRDDTGFHEVKLESFVDIADRVGERIEGMRVADVMIRTPKTVHANWLISQLANEFFENRIHRLPVVDGADLVGIVTTLDLVRLITNPANARKLT